MPSDQDQLAQAADILGVATLVDKTLKRDDPVFKLQLAAAVMGAAEGRAIRHASQVVACGGQADPMPMVSSISFQATGMSDDGTNSSRLYWSIWLVRRLQSQLTTMIDQKEDKDLSTALRIVNALHAMLSAVAYDPDKNVDSYAGCIDSARQELEASVNLLT